MRFFALLLLLTTFAAHAHEVIVRTQWQGYFEERGVQGTIVVFDSDTRTYYASESTRSKERAIPASTFKIPHTLFALDAGVVDDRTSTFKWNGEKQPFRSWESDQTLSSAFRLSTAWVYQQIAERLGEQAERAYLSRTDYGNRSTGGGLRHFWLTGGLAISPLEQVDFLRRLEAEELPFSQVHQSYVKDLMLVEAQGHKVLRGKSGWAFEKNPQVGWYVGWMELNERTLFFALNIDITNPSAHLPLRLEIVKRVLSDLGGA